MPVGINEFSKPAIAVGFTGPKANLMREILSDNIGEYCDDPETTVLDDISTETLNVLGGKLESRMTELKGGQFDSAALTPEVLEQSDKSTLDSENVQFESTFKANFDKAF